MTAKRIAPHVTETRGAWSAPVKPEPIIPEKAQNEWRKGCMWAGVAFGICFGAMFAIGILMGWI